MTVAFCIETSSLNILVKRQPLAVGQPLVVALSDFGPSREKLPLGLDQAPEQPMTPGMVTVYYRAPEILMGQTYALPSDVWSTGITFVQERNRVQVGPRDI